MSIELPWTTRAPRPPDYDAVVTTSRYLVMPDGVRIAIDVTLPRRPRQRLPTILRQTRYHRRMDLRPPFDRAPLRKAFDQQYDARRYFVQRGYAWVDVCVRGSGASGGTRPTPWAADERADGGQILEWIVNQPWSNGRVGARGISYDGTAAEFLMWENHPGLRAVAPRFSVFDIYDDIAMPGGIHLEQFTRNWARFNDALDRNRFDLVLALIFGLSGGGLDQLADSPYGGVRDRIFARALNFHGPVSAVLKRFVRGVAATEDDPTGDYLREHLRERIPALDVHEAGVRMTFRDDRQLSERHPELGVDDFSPHAIIDDLQTSVPVFHYTGWFDGAYQRAAIKRFATLDDPGQRLIIGPWEHGGRQNVSPWESARDVVFDHEAELMRFFDAHLTNEEAARSDWYQSPRVRYFTIGAEQWRTSESWPPPGFEVQRFRVSPMGQLTENVSEGSVSLTVAGAHGTGAASRWRSLLPMLALTHYVPRSGEVASFDGATLDRDVEVTGHPLVHVELVSTTDDPRLFAYLEDVDSSGVAHYVTEGQLRGLHRRLKRDRPRSHEALPFHSYRRADARPTQAGSRVVFEFDLLPVSYLFRRGHRLRLVLAGADVDHFEVGPVGVHTIDTGKSWVELPVAHRI